MRARAPAPALCAQSPCGTLEGGVGAGGAGSAPAPPGGPAEKGVDPAQGRPLPSAPYPLPDSEDPAHMTPPAL